MIDVYTLDQKSALHTQIDRLSEVAWPTFLLHGDIHHWHLLFTTYTQFQLLLCEPANNLIAIGHTVPIYWDGNPFGLPETIEEIILRADRARRSGQIPNTLCALAAVVDLDHQGQGLSRRVIEEMVNLAHRHGCSSLIAPVRPIWKSRYPLISMERYCAWRRDDGAPYDPWLRVHWRMGAQSLGVTPNTLTVEGTIVEWQSWTSMYFPESGQYIVPGALQPVMIDCENDRGRYEDPNFWMLHKIDP